MEIRDWTVSAPPVELEATRRRTPISVVAVVAVVAVGSAVAAARVTTGFLAQVAEVVLDTPNRGWRPHWPAACEPGTVR
jgi:hypothetical protein